jgi:hypothetical protein
MRSILDRSFRYVPSTQTDLRKTFARVRRELRKAKEDRDAAGAGLKVVLIRQLKAQP